MGWGVVGDIGDAVEGMLVPTKERFDGVVIHFYCRQGWILLKSGVDWKTILIMYVPTDGI